MRDVLSAVGPRLRAARLARGLKLDDLAELAGVSVSTISRLENGKRQANLELLIPLTHHLGIRIDDLVAPSVSRPRVRRPTINRHGLVMAPLAPEAAPIRTYKITYPVLDAEPALRVHDGYEWLYVLSGRLRLRLDDQDLELTRGEAAEFDTRVPHAIWAIGGRPAQVISIFNDAGARMLTHSAP